MIRMDFHRDVPVVVHHLIKDFGQVHLLYDHLVFSMQVYQYQQLKNEKNSLLVKIPIFLNVNVPAAGSGNRRIFGNLLLIVCLIEE